MLSVTDWIIYICIGMFAATTLVPLEEMRKHNATYTLLGGPILWVICLVRMIFIVAKRKYKNGSPKR